jgi:hypothetical protein
MQELDDSNMQWCKKKLMEEYKSYRIPNNMLPNNNV